ncbi:MAG: T9SS type A sorting domain-containing protein [Bacteroidia bacterium]
MKKQHTVYSQCKRSVTQMLQRLSLSCCPEISQFTSKQENFRNNIANQCPLAGGRAVYQARSMSALLYENVIYDDDALCEVVNMQWRVAQPKVINAAKLSVYPNPTNGNLNFLFSEKLVTDTALSIYDALGKRIQVISLSSETSRYILDTSPLPQGIYFYKVNGIEGKFVVIK